MTKEFGKLSRQQLRELFALHHQIAEQGKDLSEISVEKQDTVSEILQSGIPWSWWYELPYNEFLVFALVKFGLWEQVSAAAKTDDPQQAALDFINKENKQPLPDPDHYPPEEQGIISSLFFAMMNNISAQRIYGVTMNALIEAASTDDEALFNAVLVDRSAVSCPTIIQRIQIASLQQDDSFMNMLAKSITRTRARKPAAKYDELRLMLAIIEEAKPLANIPIEELYNLLAEDLELYPTEGLKDPFSAFGTYLQRRKPSRT